MSNSIPKRAPARVIFAAVLGAAHCAAPTPIEDTGTSAHAPKAERLPFSTEVLAFTFDGRTLSGLLDTPRNGPTKGLVILVPGSGRTHVHPGRSNLEMRSHFAAHGFSVYAYDKAGCGLSEGVFDYNQTVQHSSRELLAAVQELRRRRVPGADFLGMWGISRAGWIIPLALSQDPTIAFWISVSGPTHLSNMRYLLETNWRLAGRSEEDVGALSSEWMRGTIIQRTGGTYEAYVAATPRLANDPFIEKLRGPYTKKKFESFQNWLLQNKPEYDPETKLMVFVPGFRQVLRSIRIPVLAVFGEGDSQVDWRATRALYRETMVTNLTVRTLANCGHVMQSCKKCEYGGPRLKGIRENGLGRGCPGFLESMTAWLDSRAPASGPPESGKVQR